MIINGNNQRVIIAALPASMVIWFQDRARGSGIDEGDEEAPQGGYPIGWWMIWRCENDFGDRVFDASWVHDRPSMTKVDIHQ